METPSSQFEPREQITVAPKEQEIHPVKMMAPIPRGISSFITLVFFLFIFVVFAYVLWFSSSYLFSRGSSLVRTFFSSMYTIETPPNVHTNTPLKSTTTKEMSSPLRTNNTLPSSVSLYYATRKSASFSALTSKQRDAVPSNFSITGSIIDSELEIYWTKGQPGLAEAYLVNQSSGKTYNLYGWDGDDITVGNTHGNWRMEMPPFLQAGSYIVRAYPAVEPYGGYVESNPNSPIVIPDDENGLLAFRFSNKSVHVGDRGIAVKVVINNPLLLQYPVRTLNVFLEQSDSNGRTIFSRQIHTTGTYIEGGAEFSQVVFGWSLLEDITPGYYMLRATLSYGSASDVVDEFVSTVTQPIIVQM